MKASQLEAECTHLEASLQGWHYIHVRGCNLEEFLVITHFQVDILTKHVPLIMSGKVG